MLSLGNIRTSQIETLKGQLSGERINEFVKACRAFLESLTNDNGADSDLAFMTGKRLSSHDIWSSVPAEALGVALRGVDREVVKTFIERAPASFRKRVLGSLVVYEPRVMVRHIEPHDLHTSWELPELDSNLFGRFTRQIDTSRVTIVGTGPMTNYTIVPPSEIIPASEIKSHIVAVHKGVKPYRGSASYVMGTSDREVERQKRLLKDLESVTQPVSGNRPKKSRSDQPSRQK